MLIAEWARILFHSVLLVVKLSLNSSEWTGNQKLFTNEDFISSPQGTLLTQDYSEMVCGIRVAFSALLY